MFFIIVLLFLGLLGILSCRQALIAEPLAVLEFKAPKIFRKMATYLYKKKLHFFRTSINSSQEKVIGELKVFVPEGHAEWLHTAYRIDNLAQILFLIGVVALLSMTIWIGTLQREDSYSEYSIARNEYGLGEKSIVLEAEREDGERHEYPVVVSEREYTRKELEELLDSFLQELESVILQDNVGWEHVSRDLRLVETLPGYPFTVDWSVEPYQTMDDSGRIQDIKENTEAELFAVIRYGEVRWNKNYPFCIICENDAKEEIWYERLQKELEKNLENSSSMSNVVLPKTLEGHSIKWQEKAVDYSLLLFGAGILSALFIPSLQKQQIHRKWKSRKEAMLKEYAVIVHELTLYLGAGMTMKRAWIKVASRHSIDTQTTRVGDEIYRQMQVTVREMDSGISEQAAYERFADRIGITEYTKLCALLVQNLRKGNKELLKRMEEEANKAILQQKNLVRKRGEEAGTKMLFPMMLLLTMVMILIMAPAFITF